MNFVFSNQKRLIADWSTIMTNGDSFRLKSGCLDGGKTVEVTVVIATTIERKDLEVEVEVHENEATVLVIVTEKEVTVHVIVKLKATVEILDVHLPDHMLLK